MPIIIKIKEQPSIEKIYLKAKKTIDGNIIVVDHPEIDIVLAPKTKKVLAASPRACVPMLIGKQHSTNPNIIRISKVTQR